MFHVFRKISCRTWSISALLALSNLLLFWFGGLLAGFIFFIIGVFSLFYTAQDILVYHPNDPPDSRIFVLRPSNYKLPYESIKIKSKDGVVLHMFLIKQSHNCNHIPTMIYFHGNAGNIGQRLANAAGFYHHLNINILMVEYRGYGLSEGKPSEGGFYLDAQTAFEFIMKREDLDVTKVIVFGRSLGGAVAIDLVSRSEYSNKIWAVIVENTFTSIPDMADIIVKWRCLKWLPLFCHKNKYDSLNKMSSVVRPTLVICGSEDKLVPPSMGSDLYKECYATCKKLIVLAQGGHDDTWMLRNYYPSIQEFLTNVPPLPCEIGPFCDDTLITTRTHTVQTV